MMNREGKVRTMKSIAGTIVCLVILFIAGCSNNHTIEVSPVKLKKDEKQLLNLSGTSTSELKVLKMANQTEKNLHVRYSIDQYVRGKKSGVLATEEKLKHDQTGRVSFGYRDIDNMREWYIGSPSGKVSSQIKKPAREKAYGMVGLYQKKALKINKWTPVAVFISSSKHQMYTEVIDNKTSFQRLLKRNDNVYVLNLKASNN